MDILYYIAVFVTALFAFSILSRRRIERQTGKYYWHVLCYLSRYTTGANAYAVASGIQVPTWIAYETLIRLHHEGNSTFKAISGDEKEAWYFNITPEGIGAISEHREQLEASGLNPA